MADHQFIACFETSDGAHLYEFIRVTADDGSSVTPQEAAHYSATATARMRGHALVALRPRRRSFVTTL